ncbi:hypothetical protein [Vibrio sp. SCSIO 43136]|nr:hypothetical protein [Vibrio sp. SCSIO 43136]USD67734.1 hypothetical protein J4N39_16230 [Vibrio sp. SCSIO 43136]
MNQATTVQLNTSLPINKIKAIADEAISLAKMAALVALPLLALALFWA